MSRTGDKFQRLRIFVTLVKEGSFAGAAARLQLKSPTISKALQLLEEELNTQLIVRSTRSMHLTEPGERYFQKASYLINELDELDNETRQFSGTPRGRLRSVNTCWGHYCLNFCNSTRTFNWNWMSPTTSKT